MSAKPAERFSALKFHPHPNWAGGIQALTFFPNSYGASVVRHGFSYGGESGLYELAVLAGTDGDWELTYATPVTDDVLGHLSESDVTKALKAIAALPADLKALTAARKRQKSANVNFKKLVASGAAALLGEKQVVDTPRNLTPQNFQIVVAALVRRFGGSVQLLPTELERPGRLLSKIVPIMGRPSLMLVVEDIAAEETDPAELFVCHRCDNPRCCNPAHLFLGTPADNSADMMRKGRHRAVSKENHPRAKITTLDVGTIRASQRSHRALARAYGISKTQVGRIKRWESWL